VKSLPVVLAIAVGGSAGALARYGVMLALGALTGRLFYLVTLLINVSGSLCLGLLYGAGQKHGLPAWVTGLLGVGVLGAYTTFSTFSVEIVRLLHDGRVNEALAYVLASVLLGVLAAWLGARWTMA
jgi:CrcB protein